MILDEYNPLGNSITNARVPIFLVFSMDGHKPLDRLGVIAYDRNEFRPDTRFGPTRGVMMKRIYKSLAVALAIAIGTVGLSTAPVKAAPTQQEIIQLKILQQVLRRQLVATIKLQYCQSASPTQARCR